MGIERFDAALPSRIAALDAVFVAQKNRRSIRRTGFCFRIHLMFGTSQATVFGDLKQPIA